MSAVGGGRVGGFLLCDRIETNCRFPLLRFTAVQPVLAIYFVLFARMSKRLVGAVDEYDGDRFFTRLGGKGKTVATPLLLCLVCIELSDFVFAVDSIPAVLGISQARKGMVLGLLLTYFGLVGFSLSFYIYVFGKSRRLAAFL